MSLAIALRSTSQTHLCARWGKEAIILDVTSHGRDPWRLLSPFYPHRSIPVPLSPPGITAQSVEGIWQGLKEVEGCGVDLSRFTNVSMRGLKRRGRVLGHRAGVGGTTLLSYVEARRHIYLPAYRWVLEHRLQNVLAQLQDLLGTKPTVLLLDYTTNGGVNNTTEPLSHAALVKYFLEGNWPE